MRINKAHLAFLHDIGMAALSLVLAFYLRVGSDLYLKSYFLDVVIYAAPMYAVIAAITFQSLRMYKGIWRYASVPDLIAIAKGAVISICLFVFVLAIATRLHNFPRSVPIIQLFLLVCMLGGPRFLYRFWRDRRLKLTKKSEGGVEIPVVLIGATDGAELFVRATLNSQSSDYNVVAILDETGLKENRSMFGIPVYGLDLDDLKGSLKNVTKRTGEVAQKLIFTNHVPEYQARKILQKLDPQTEALGLSLARLPNLTEFKKSMIEGEVSVQAVALEDLLGRPQSELDLDAIKNFIEGKRVLITGAGGTIGSEITRQVASYGPSQLTLIDHSEYNLYLIDGEVSKDFGHLDYKAALGNVRNRERIRQVFEQAKPDVVFHAAALKHVPMVELNPEEGVLTNLIGTQNVADACVEFGAQTMVQISTDKAVNPTNVMGASKRLGELYAQALDLNANKGNSTRFFTVRFGNVLGSSGSVVPLFQRQIAAGGPLTVTHPDIKRYFMTVREAVGLVLQASAKGHDVQVEDGSCGLIFVLDMGEPIKIQDIARKMIRLSGKKLGEDIDIVFTGLRPGEKLYEELFDQSETPLKTNIDGVMGARPTALDLGILKKNFGSIELACNQGNREQLYKLLQHIVSGYKYDPEIWESINKKLDQSNEQKEG
ncbi:MAG: nucleotide sugar dehydratase [Rickettsiales bacterium]|nr:nucleotide sugar dehydratase [Rickettsiales bacterium]